MTDQFGSFPNGALMAATILIAARTAGELGGLTPQIGTKIPDNADWSAGVVMVMRVGGLPAERIRVDRPRIQVDCWHADPAAAYDLAEACRLALFEAEGKVISNDSGDIGSLAGVDVDTPATWMFDPLSLKPRYMFAVRFTTHQVDA